MSSTLLGLLRQTAALRESDSHDDTAPKASALSEIERRRQPLPLWTTRSSAGPDCRILAMRKYGRWHGLPTDAAHNLPGVAEQRGRTVAGTV